jgi:hypothetical protein
MTKKVYCAGADRNPLADIVERVRKANPRRSYKNLDKRFMRALIEFAELAEAQLFVTARANYKGKTWKDVREEVVDTWIVTTDLLLTPLPGEDDVDPIIVQMLGKKLAKWHRNRAKSRHPQDDT